MKRTIINKAAEIKCQLCDETLSLYGMVGHIRHKHRKECTVEQYVERFGEFRKQKNPPKNLTVCTLCNGSYSPMGMKTHLRDSHNGMTPDEYVRSGGTEYRKLQLEYNEMLQKSGGKFVCKICNEECRNEKHLTNHVNSQHDMSKKSYIKTHIFPDGIPLCMCGCNQPVKLLEQYPYHRMLISGHGLNGELNPMYGRTHGFETTEKMKLKAAERQTRSEKSFDTKPELKFKEFLHSNEILYESQCATEYGIIDFYLPTYDLYVEIDGVYWHPTNYVNLNAQLILSSCAQKRRDTMTNLIRIREDDIDKITHIDDLHALNYKYNFELDYAQIIISKEYLKRTSYDKANLVRHLWKFISAFQPTFPKITTHENLPDVISKIQQLKLDEIIDDNVFRNNCSTVGVSLLKSTFCSYWNASFKGSPTPIQAWTDQKIMYRVIKYRIGMNNSNEIFDFSLHQLVRGLSAHRLTVSFFKPVLAAAIYDHFLTNKINPTVFDPCCGFGGRLLGFKAKFPRGKYIGCEPNPETFSELVKLAENFTNVHLYNCKLEDFDVRLLPNVDLTFTSIPYFDLETYSVPTHYESIENWKNTFIEKLKQLPNLLVNVPTDLRYLFDSDAIEYLISTNTSHFNKSQSQKFEFLLQL